MTGSSRPGDVVMPPIRVFHDVPVLRTTAVERTVYNGGPVWPDPGDADWLWHRRADRRMTVLPNPVLDDLPRREGVFIWGGQVHRQFGHQVAEYSTRVLQSLRDAPSGQFLFTLWPGGTADAIPPHFWAVMDWYGVPRDRIEFISRSFVASSLWVAPQAEQLGGPGPSSEYLDLLAELERARGLVVAPFDTLYVSREGMLQRCLGTWAGESYLSAQLTDLGVRVIRPEDMPLRDQLAAYASARSAIFADGSALHGRQLLGYHPQTIAVITRRPIGKLAEHMIAPRCDSVRYVSRPRDVLHLVLADGEPDANRALSLYDEASLLAAMQEFGLDLARVWDTDAFNNAAEADVVTWLQNAFRPQRQNNPGFDWPASFHQVRADLVRCGLEHLLPVADAHARPPSLGFRLKRRLRRNGGLLCRRLRGWLGRAP